MITTGLLEKYQSMACFGVCLSQTDTHTHIHISSCSAYHPQVGKKHCSCYRSLLSACYKRETPVCRRPLSALNGLAKVSSVQHIQRQHQEATYQICETIIDFLPFCLQLKRALCPCEFRCDHECSIVPRLHSRPLPGVLTYN